MPNAVKYKTGNLTGSLQKGNVALGVSGSLGPTSTTGWYNGPNPPTSGLYQIIETAASGDPDIYCPQNDAELIKFARWKGATGADTGSVAAVLAWVGTQTNLMAINFQYESIVTDGLLLNLDAGFVGSYPTTSSAWYDISGNNNSDLLVNGPTFSSANSGSIVFDGVDDWSTVNSGASILSNVNYTKIAWFYPTSFTTNNNIVSGGSTGQHAFWLAGGNRLNAGHNGGWGTVISTTVLSLNTWYFGAVTFDTTNGWKLYLNGTQESTSSSTITFTGTGDIQIGSFGNGNIFTGRIAISQVYNKVLSQAEITQNYNAQKGRFGL